MRALKEPYRQDRKSYSERLRRSLQRALMPWITSENTVSVRSVLFRQESKSSGRSIISRRMGE